MDRVEYRMIQISMIIQEFVDNTTSRTRHTIDVCIRGTGYGGGRSLRVPWWRQKAAEDHMRVTVEAIPSEERVRRGQ